MQGNKTLAEYTLTLKDLGSKSVEVSVEDDDDESSFDQAE